MNRLSNTTYDQLSVGNSAELIEIINQKVVLNFIKLFGDNNPLHCDTDYAASTEFGQPVVHGAILTSFCSKLVGVYLPGKYALYLSNEFKFHDPVFINDKIKIRGLISRKVDAFKIIEITIEIKNLTANKIAATGKALVRLLK